MVKNKTVLLPITIPRGNYCWDQVNICGWFSNEGGHPMCDMYIDHLEYTIEGKVPKPLKCQELNEI